MAKELNPPNVDPEPTAEEVRNAMSAIGQRRLVGYLGILLPILCFGFTILWSHRWLPSISHYYYTPVHGPFIAILCGLGMVLYVYRGYDDWDNRATDIAALAALGVGLFPTARGGVTGLPHLRRLFLTSETFNGIVHDVSAISLFVMFFFISGFLFTRNPPQPGQRPSFEEFLESIKKTWLFMRTPHGSADTPRERENALHRRCAWVILVSIVLAAVSSRKGTLDTIAPWPWMAIFETTAIFAFAISWLAKNKEQPNVVKLFSSEVSGLATRLKASLVPNRKLD